MLHKKKPFYIKKKTNTSIRKKQIQHQIITKQEKKIIKFNQKKKKMSQRKNTLFGNYIKKKKYIKKIHSLGMKKKGKDSFNYPAK